MELIRKIINDSVEYLRATQEAIMSASKYEPNKEVHCRKCGEIIKLDAGEEGLCQNCI